MEDDAQYFQNSQKDIRQLLPKIKALLTARNSTTQLKAATYLLKALKDDAARGGTSTNLSDFVVKQDIIGFLCEAMATTDCHLLEIVINVLLILSVSDELARQRDSLCVAEAALRAAHILAPLSAGSNGRQMPDRVHASTLRLIALVLQRWTEIRGGRPVSEVCRTEQLLAAINRVVVPETGAAPMAWPKIVVLAAGDALTALVVAVAKEVLMSAPLKATFKDTVTLVSAITSTLDVIKRLDGDDALQAICHLAEAAVKYSCSLEKMEKTDSEDKMLKGQSFAFFKNVVTGITDAILAKEPAPGAVHSVISFLATVMEVEISVPLRSSLAHRLSAKGFLALLPQMTDDRDLKTKSSKYLTLEQTGYDNWGRRRRQGSQPANIRLLVSLLTALAADLLPETPFYEASKLADAAVALPINVNDWGSQIESPASWAETRAFVLLWAYCRCLCSKSLQEIRLLRLSLLPSLCCYLIRFTESHLLVLPRALLKSIWYIFAVLSLSSDTESSGREKTASWSLVKATDRLLLVLRSQQNLKPVYTHNPALLYWIFTTSCAQLQTAVVMLWLEQENTAIGLGDLVRTRKDVAFRLLDVVQTGSALVAARASAVLETALTGGENAENDGHLEEACPSERFHLATTIWSILPGVLSQVTQTSCGADRADCMLKLALRAAAAIGGTTTTDGCGDISLAVTACGGSVVRTASQLAPLLASSSPEWLSPVFQSSGLQVALLLLQFTQYQADSRVFTIFSEYHSFTRTLVSRIINQFKKSPEIAETSARLLTAILDCQKSFGLPHAGEIATVPAEKILLLLQQPGLITAPIVGMLQAQLELQCTASQPLVQLENANSVFWRALFLRLQMMCSKDIAVISLPAWKILTLLLSSNVCDLLTRRHLASQPWTHQLLRIVLASGPSELDLALERDTDHCVKAPPEEVILFMLAWLKAPRETQHRWRQLPTPDMLTETCGMIGAALIRWTSNGLCSTTEQAIAKHLLLCGASLPQDTATGLQRLLDANLPDLQKLCF